MRERNTQPQNRKSDCSVSENERQSFAPVIEGYFFGDDYIAGVLEHNRKVAAERSTSNLSPRIGMLFLSLPSICNLKCPYCYTWSSRSLSSSGLSDREIQHVVKSASRLGASSVVVAGDGEPFLSLQIWSVIKAVERHGMRVVIFTNGSLISSEVAMRLKSAPVSLIMKLNSFRPDVLDAAVGVPGAHRPILAGLDVLLSIGFRAPRFALQSAIMKTNLADIREIHVFCREQNIVPYIETYVAAGRGACAGVRRELEPSVEQVTAVVNELHSIDQTRFELEWRPALHARVVGYGACTKNYTAVSVRPNGDVYRCITETDRLGSIREKSFDQILFDAAREGALSSAGCTGCNSIKFSIPVSLPFGEATRDEDYLGEESVSVPQGTRM